MTPQSVRGIKKIEFQMSQEERNDVLEGSRDPFNLGSSFGESSGDGGSKSFSGLKSGLFTSNTILEELEANDSSRDSNKSSANKHSTGDINFPGLLSGSLGDALDGKLPSETVI